MSEQISRVARPGAGILAASLAMCGVLTAGCEAQPTYTDVERCSPVVGTLSYETTSFDIGAYLWDGTVRLKWDTHRLIGLQDGRAIKFDRTDDYIKYDIGGNYCETSRVRSDTTPSVPTSSPSPGPNDICDAIKNAESFREEVIDPGAFAMAGAMLSGIDMKFVVGTIKHGKYVVTDEEFVTHPVDSTLCFAADRPKS